MKRKTAFLLTLFACCVVVGFCSENLSAANGRLSHPSGSPVPPLVRQSASADPSDIWQAILRGLSGEQFVPADRDSAPHAEEARAVTVRCPELRTYPQLVSLATHRPFAI